TEDFRVNSSTFCDVFRFPFPKHNIRKYPNKCLILQHLFVFLINSSKQQKPKLKTRFCSCRKVRLLVISDSASRRNYPKSGGILSWFLLQIFSCINDRFGQRVSSLYFWYFLLCYKFYARQIQPKTHETDFCAFPR